MRSCLIDGEVVCCDKRGLARFDVLRRRHNEARTFLYAFVEARKGKLSQPEGGKPQLTDVTAKLAPSRTGGAFSVTHLCKDAAGLSVPLGENWSAPRFWALLAGKPTSP
jgi:hypothetical protein